MHNSPEVETFLIDAAGHKTELTIPVSQLDELHRPLVASLSSLAQEHGRLIVLLAGPSGTGKTTLAALWGKLASESNRIDSWTVLPMDGFHLPHRSLRERTITVDGRDAPMTHLKGAPETFDLELLLHTMQALGRGDAVTWPLYDRVLHDPVPDAIQVPPRGVVIVEGLYLLLDRPGWMELRSMGHRGIFVEAPEDLCRARVVARHIRGGRSRVDAESHWQRSDAVNTQLVNGHRHGIDILLRCDADGRLHILRAGRE